MCARYLHPFPEVWRMSVKRTESIATVAHRTHHRQQRYSDWFLLTSATALSTQSFGTDRSMEKARRWYFEEGGHGNPTLSSFNCDHKTPWPNSMMCCLDSCFSETPVSAKPVYYADSRTMNFIPLTFPPSVRVLLSCIRWKSCRTNCTYRKENP